MIRKELWWWVWSEIEVSGDSNSYCIEAAAGGVLYQKMFIKNSQNSQEKTCARVSFFIKLQAWGLQLY